MGTFQGGLNVRPAGSRRFFHFRNDPGESTSLAGNSVTTLLQDRDGDLWIGTLAHGLDVFNKKTGRFSHFFAETGVPYYRMISSLMQDRQGNIWIGSNRGRLGLWDTQKYEFKHFQLPFNNIITYVSKPVALKDLAKAIDNAMVIEAAKSGGHLPSA